MIIFIHFCWVHLLTTFILMPNVCSRFMLSFFFFTSRNLSGFYLHFFYIFWCFFPLTVCCINTRKHCVILFYYLCNANDGIIGFFLLLVFCTHICLIDLHICCAFVVYCAAFIFYINTYHLNEQKSHMSKALSGLHFTDDFFSYFSSLLLLFFMSYLMPDGNETRSKWK